MELFYVIRSRYGNRAPPAVSPQGFRPSLPLDDAQEEIGEAAVAGESISGLSVILDYRDTKGAKSTRQVSCIRIENAKGVRYLRAFCHHRGAQRLFRVDRIDTVMDVETGEELARGHEYFGQFSDDRISASPPGWGLSPVQRADLGAGLTVLTFLSRCDGHMHPSEAEEIDTFVASWWIRAEIRAEIPESEIRAYARRMAPDVEAFVLAAQRVWANAILASLIAGYARRVIEADGMIASEEHYWIRRLVDWLDRMD